MSPHLRKLIGSIALLVFLATYVVVAATLADHLPDHRLVQLLFFAVVGIAWGVPLLPLFTWMELGRFHRHRGG